MGLINGEILHSEARPRRVRRRAYAVTQAAVLLMLDSFGLLCVYHFISGATNPLAGAYYSKRLQGNDTQITVKTNGFEFAPDTDVAAAAPGMSDLHCRLGAPTTIYL